MTPIRNARAVLPPVTEPTALKERVLWAARLAAAGGHTAAPPPDRWFAWDLAWVAALLLLVAAHLWLAGPHQSAVQVPHVTAKSTAPVDREFEGSFAAVVAEHEPLPARNYDAAIRDLLQQI